jgi:aminoglycoside phosphotransferase (APT) family kinase protein
MPVLADDERAFLTERMAVLGEAFAALAPPLGRGLIHNDAHIDNLLVAERSSYGYVLGDWDGASWGPREIDLVQEGAPGNRFGESEELRQAFSRAYGYDIADWPGWRTLRDLRDLHSLAAYIRTAPSKLAAQAELKNRLDSLRSGDRTIIWRAVA